MTTLGRSFSDCLPQRSAQEDADRLHELLKSAAPEDSPGDEDESTVGVNPDQYPDPSDRPQANAHASWGEETSPHADSGKSTEVHHSNAVLDGYKAGKETFLKRHFNSFSKSSKTDQALVGQHLDHAKSGDYEGSKPFQEAGSKRQPEHVETVLDKTKRILGTF